MLKRYADTEQRIQKEIVVQVDSPSRYWEDDRRHKWSKWLYEVYVNCRLSPGWDTICHCYDDEDKKHFQMLEEERLAGHIRALTWDSSHPWSTRGK